MFLLFMFIYMIMLPYQVAILSRIDRDADFTTPSPVLTIEVNTIMIIFNIYIFIMVQGAVPNTSMQFLVHPNFIGMALSKQDRGKSITLDD